MRPFELVPLVGAICNLLVTLFVLSRGPRLKINQIYFVWGVCISIWNFGTFFMFRVTNDAQALFWARFLQFGVIFIPVTLFHLSTLIAQVRVGRTIYLLYVIQGLLALSNFTDFFIKEVKFVGYAYYAVGGPGFWIFSTTLSLTVFSVILLLVKRTSFSPLYRSRLNYLIFAQSALVIFGLNDILPILGIYTYPLLGWPVYPVGSIAAIFYGLVVGYSVLQHQLLDIHVTLSRSAAQLVRLLFMSLIGFSMLLVVSWIKPGDFTYFTFFSSLLVLVTSAVVASFFFPQFFGSSAGVDALERHILGDRFEYHARVQNLIHTVRSFPEPQSLLEELDELLVNTVKVRSYQLILLDETTRGFRLFHSHPLRPHVQLSEWRIDSPVLRFFQETGASYLSCRNIYQNSRSGQLERAAREQLVQFDPEFCFPFLSGRELVGFMLLGGKVNQDVFTPHDIRLLSELAENLGFVLNQIRLRNQLQVVHEQDLLGRMSRGLAHDLNNLLTPVQTLLQLFQEDRLHHDNIDELLPMALRNLTTVRSYVNEALFFSHSNTLQGFPGPLDETIRGAISLVQPALAAKGISINSHGLYPVELEMDAVLIKRLISNLLSNAIDASPTGSEINVRILALPRTELSRDWYRVQITDQGEGISPENLKRVFTPYFTTKNTGDGNRGFGLGLAIARKIVHLHGGNLSINSKEKKGTTVFIDLPTRQVPVQARGEEAIPA